MNEQMVFYNNVLYIEKRNYELKSLLYETLYCFEDVSIPNAPQKYFNPNYSFYIYSTLCVLGDFYYRPWSVYNFDGKTLSNVFLSQVITQYSNYINNPQISSIDYQVFLDSFTISTDHNMYFSFTFENNGRPTRQYLQINDHVINVLKMALSSHPEMKRIIIENIKLTQNKLYNTRFNHFIYILNEIKKFKLTISPKSNIYVNCAVKANGFFNIYQMNDNKPTAKQEFENFGVINYFFELSIPNSPDLIPCIRMYMKEPIKELKPDYDKISHLLHWLTMGDTNTFDRLALDFVHRIMQPGYQSRNTIVSGDIVKLYMWDHLNILMLEHINFCSRGSYIFANKSYSDINVSNYMNQIDIPIDHKHIPVNSNLFDHYYYFCNPNESPSELDKGNKHIHINFEFGEKNFNLYWLKRDDYIWLAEIFFMHGWHIINNSTKTRKSKERNITIEFIKTFLQKEGKYHNDNHSIRLPLALVYELYCAYFNIEKNNPRATPVTNIELHKIASEKLHIEYGNMKITKEDVEYVTEVIKPMMQKYKIQFEDNWITEENGKSKTSWALICTVKNDFWEYLEKSRLSYDLNSTEYEAFDRYVYNLYTEYKETLVYMPIPEETEKWVPIGQRFINPENI